MSKSKIWFNIRDSFWFMPAIYSLITLILVITISLTDTWIVSLFREDILKNFLIEKDTAKKIYSTLVTAILTMTTLSFSVIMVVLTTYSSQFSPRILQNFMKNKFTQHVLGIYCSGFISALVLLFLVDNSKPFIGPIIMVVIAMINLGAFVYFIHHSSRFLQINNLINLLKNEGTTAINLLYKKEQPYHSYRYWREMELLELKTKEKTMLTANESGYVQNIDWESVINWATKNKSVIELHVQPGSFIPEKLPLMTIWSEEKIEAKINSFVVLGNERSDVQDFGYTIQKLEEIALRAISPSTNDPHTAVNCMNRIGVLLTELGEVQSYTPYLADTEDNLRIIHKPTKFEDYLYKSFYEIRYYGQNDVSVLYGIINVLYKIAVVSSEDIKQKIWEFHFYIMEVVKWDKLSELDQAHLEKAYNNLKRSCDAVS